ncbi:MAG: hypothetical protein JWO25_2245, partial [Alphaproteobacteria bacterium]|nr:hypothetical protein [Alphaproteobacteria bacterium]
QPYQRQEDGPAARLMAHCSAHPLFDTGAEAEGLA